MKTPLISILIPVYNHESYIEECIRSIWFQHLNEVEIIAIDDGSTDASYDVLKTLATVSPVAMYTDRQENLGIVKTLNKALRLARGEFVLCLASDDKLMENALAPALEETKKTINVGFSIFNAKYFGRVNREVYSSKTAKFFQSNINVILRELYTAPPKPLLLQSTIINKKLIDQLGGWNEEIALDDWPMFIRLFERVCDGNMNWFYDGNLFLSSYRIHGNNVHRNINRQIMMCEDVVRRYCPNHLKKEAFANVYLDFALALIRRLDMDGVGLLRKAIDASNYLMVMKLLLVKAGSYAVRYLH